MSQKLIRYLQVFLCFSTKRRPQSEWMISDPLKNITHRKTVIGDQTDNFSRIFSAGEGPVTPITVCGKFLDVLCCELGEGPAMVKKTRCRSSLPRVDFIQLVPKLSEG